MLSGLCDLHGDGVWEIPWARLGAELGCICIGKGRKMCKMHRR